MATIASVAILTQPSSVPVDAGEAPRALPTTGSSLRWLDALKGIAVLAVVLDHAFIVDDYLLWKHLYFSVSWFIFLAGVSNTYSGRRRGFDLRQDTIRLWKRRLATLLGPYLLASAVTYVALDFRRTSLQSFLRQLVLFHTLPPDYFIALLLQLLVLFPILFVLLYRAGWKGRLAVAVTIVPVAAVLSRQVTFPWVLGAHYLFGASFLYLFVLGMLLEPALTSGRIHPLVWLGLSLPLFVWAEGVNVATNGAVMTHPPSNVLVIYAVGLIGTCYAACRLFGQSAPVRLLALLGRRSLDIFLYHYLFILPILQFRDTAWTARLPFVWSQVVLMVATVPMAIVGSILAARAGSALVLTLTGWLSRALRIYQLIT